MLIALSGVNVLRIPLSLKLPSSHCHPLCTELALPLGKEIITLTLRNWYVLHDFLQVVYCHSVPRRQSTIVVMLTEALGFYVVRSVG